DSTAECPRSVDAGRTCAARCQLAVDQRPREAYGDWVGRQELCEQLQSLAFGKSCIGNEARIEHGSFGGTRLAERSTRPLRADMVCERCVDGRRVDEDPAPLEQLTPAACSGVLGRRLLPRRG